MKFAQKCPKCGGEIQTKSIKKSIGLGFVDIPVAQFCLNRSCDWYQDFSEAKKPEEIKEGVLQIKVPSIKNKIPEIKKPALSQKHIIALGSILTVIVIFLLFNSVLFAQPQSRQSEAPKIDTPVLNTPDVSATSSTPAPVLVKEQRKQYPIKMDVGHGFNPKVKIINNSDNIVWSNEENQRTRVVLISKDVLFENQLMEYGKKFSFQFNQPGNYTFVLAEYPSLKEYPNVTGIVIVK